MPLTDGEYDQLSVEQIQDALEGELRAEFGNDIDLTESSVFTTLATVLAEVISTNQESSIQDVYQSAFLETASGESLDRVVAIIGIQRQSAVHATGVERFEAFGPVEQDYTIQRGTTVLTSGDEIIEFETTEVAELELIDDFETVSLEDVNGDTASASIVSDAAAPQGSNVLELDATNGAHIYKTDTTVEQGVTLHSHVQPNTGTAPVVTFGVQPLTPDEYYQFAFDEAADEVRLEVVSGGTVSSTIDTLTGAGLTAGSYHEIEFDWNITNNIGATVYAPDGSELGTLGGSDDTYQRGYCGWKSGDATSTKRFDFYTESATSANIRAAEGGAEGNVGANSITNVATTLNGVAEVTNLYPTGDPDYIDTSGAVFTAGQNEETDEELRQRAQDAVAGGGAATHDALVAALVNDIDNVLSVTIFQNKTDNDNTGSGGLPPHSFEAVVFGGDDQAVAETIFETKSITSNDYAGVFGSSVSVDVTADSNGQTRTVQFSRPNEVSIDMTLDLVVDDTYVGDDALRDDIVRYIGGTESNGDLVIGTEVGVDVRIDAIRDIVIGDDNGVVGFDQSVDGTPIETTPTYTTVNGLEVIEVGATEVANVDATDGSITLNTREVNN